MKVLHEILTDPKGWQTLIAGVLGGGVALLAGVIAYIGALRAANRQVREMQRQLAERNRRRRIVVEWAVRVEGQRLDTEVVRVREQFPKKGWTTFSSFLSNKDWFRIDSSPLLRWEREDAALLDGATLSALEKAAETLSNYNHRIKTAEGQVRLEELPETGRKLLEDLASQADILKK
jgi:hypothetical protein